MQTNESLEHAMAALAQDPYVGANPELHEFWQAAARNELLVKTCTQCSRAHWYPRMFCPFCASEDTEWRKASGQGKIYAFSEVVRAEPPYILAYVRLDEGPVLLTNMVDCDPAALHIDQDVKVLFRPAQEGRSFPVFTPCETRG